MVASTGADPWPGIFLVLGLVTIVITSVTLGMNLMQRRATGGWDTADPLYDNSYGATFRRTMFKAYRSPIFKYFFVASYVLGVGLLVASGVTKLLG